MIASFLLLIVIAGMAVPTSAVLIPWFWITGDLMPLWHASLFIVRTGCRLAGIRVQIQGLENIPRNTACIFMANHVSNLDPPVLTSVIPCRTSIFYKNSLNKIPLLGYAMRLAEFVPVYRDGSVETAQESTQFAKRVLLKDISITTFVEGRRSSDGRLLPFKKGPFYLAMESGAPCIPVSISGTERMMHKGSMKILPGTANIIFHAALHPAQYGDREALLMAVHEAIASGLPEWMRD
jgi:1-acyl-sn-glycerol-3-phosphate acyltransferase